jgi:hypothetical protein
MGNERSITNKRQDVRPNLAHRWTVHCHRWRDPVNGDIEAGILIARRPNQPPLRIRNLTVPHGSDTYSAGA